MAAIRRPNERSGKQENATERDRQTVRRAEGRLYRHNITWINDWQRCGMHSRPLSRISLHGLIRPAASAAAIAAHLVCCIVQLLRSLIITGLRLHPAGGYCFWLRHNVGFPSAGFPSVVLSFCLSAKCFDLGYFKKRPKCSSSVSIAATFWSKSRSEVKAKDAKILFRW